jgi:CRP-like cAMP-binding protein
MTLTPDLFEDVRQLAQTVTIAAGETLFAEGDAPDYAYVRLTGTCTLSRHAQPIGNAPLDTVLDAIAILGDVPHTQRAITQTACTFLRWDRSDLRQSTAFTMAARRYLAHQLQQAQAERERIAQPVHYDTHSAQVLPGPFAFHNSVIRFVFCTAELPHLRLPTGVQRIGQSLLIGIADFRDAQYVHRPQARFHYTETTVFVPVRVGAKLGLYVPYIYPSTYEPILLGREIYGFPKRLGRTDITPTTSSLHVAGAEYLTLTHDQRTPANEASIVGAFGRLFGVPNLVTATAFRAGDTLLAAIGVPFYRRVNVFNHKRIPAVTSQHGAPQYAVDRLTQAIFSVERWHSIDHLPTARLDLGHALHDWEVTLREAYDTTLAMRLSTGRVVRDYQADAKD